MFKSELHVIAQALRASERVCNVRWILGENRNEISSSCVARLTGWTHKQDRIYTEHPSGAMHRPDRYGLTARDQRRYGRPQEATRNRAPSSFFHPQEGARAEPRDTQRCCIPMHPHRRATQTRLLRLAHAVKCRRQMSPCRRQQLRREVQPPCALLHRVQGWSKGWEARI